MAIVNRDLDASQQKTSFVVNLTPVTTGVTYPIVNVPYAGVITNFSACAMGLSGSPIVNLEIHRMTSGGFTQITGGMTNLTLQALGTSGPQAGVLAAVGYTLIAGVIVVQSSSLLTVNYNDVIVLKTSGANTAAVALSGAVVIQSTQDVRSHFGSV